jgi:hypothetical protein
LITYSQAWRAIVPPEDASAASAALICTSVLPQGTVIEPALAVALLAEELEPPDVEPPAPTEVVEPEREPAAASEVPGALMDACCTCPQDARKVRRYAAISFLMCDYL